MTTMEELNNLAETTQGNNSSWGIDKKIPIALIVVVIFQTAAITWGAATLSNNVQNYGTKIDKLELNFEKFVDKADTKFMTNTTHQLIKETAFGEIRDIKKDIETLESRVNWLEKHIK